MKKVNIFSLLTFCLVSAVALLNSHVALAQTTNIFGNATPALAVNSDSNSIELGVKFKSSVDGQITGIRFYRGNENGSGYSVHLWSVSGTSLAHRRLSASTGSSPGWRQVSFATPVKIKAGVTYVASYFTSGGRYASTTSGLNSAVTSGSLTALDSASSGGNGVYKYSSGSSFPSQTYQGSNYFVDVMFTPGSFAPSLPTVSLSASPSNVVAGQSSNLSWSSTNATSCTGTGFSTNAAMSGSALVSPSTTTSYSVSCTGAGGTATASAKVTVTAATPAPTASLVANPNSITAGQSSTLSWSSANATSCTGSGFSTSGATSGTASVTPATSANYSVSCSGAGGTATANANVNVAAVAGSTELPGPSAALFASNPYYTCVNNFYVAKTGSDSNNGSVSSPFASVGKAVNSLPANPAGYCININDGTYTLSSPISIGKGGNLASTTGFLVIRSVNLLGAHLVESSSAAVSIQMQAPYIIIDGLEIDGGTHRTSAASGIDSCYSGTTYNGIHHIFVMNSYIHDHGANGIGNCWAEYYWMIHNRLDKNAYNSWNSGISTYEPAVIPGYTPTAYDNKWTPYHNVYAYNRFNGNFTDPAGGPHTDGNGLEYDDTRHQQNSPNTLYTPMALIMGNVAWANGGSGIEVGPTSANADVFNNTVYNNYLDTNNTGTWRGDIASSMSLGVTFKNNIAYTVKGSGILTNNSPYLGGNPVSADVWIANLAFGAGVYMNSPDVFSTTLNLANANPQLVNVSSGNFAMCTGPGAPNASCSGASPGLHYGVVVPYWQQQTAGAVDIGACPSGVPVCP